VARSQKAQLDRTTKLLKGRIRALFQQLPGALGGKQEPVHQVRVAGRRLRVALPLLVRKPQGKRARAAGREVRALIKAAGAGRDLDVMLGLLGRRIKQLEQAPKELVTLRRRLMGARTRSRHQMAEALMDLDIADLRRDLRRLVARGADNVFTVLARVREVRESDGASLETAFEELADRFEPVMLHRIRIRARRLRYTAEISDAIKQASSDAPQRFKELQDLLGRVQDAFVLSGWLEQAAQRAEVRGEQAIASEARRQAKWCLEESRKRHRELLERDPRALLRGALEAMGQSRPSAA